MDLSPEEALELLLKDDELGKAVIDVMHFTSTHKLTVTMLGAAIELKRRGSAVGDLKVTLLERRRADASAPTAVRSPWRLDLWALRALRRLLPLRWAAAARPHQHTGRSGSAPASDQDRARWEAYGRDVKPH